MIIDKQFKLFSKKYIDLISDIQKGQIKIPKFQRNFIWDLDKTAKLLDSILKGYPVGIFVLWETNKKISEIKNIGNLKLPLVLDNINTQYILDGHQRISSLYAAYLGAKTQKKEEKKIIDYKNIYIDLDKDIKNSNEQVIVSEKPKEIFIKLNEVLNFDKNFSKIKKRYSDYFFKKIYQYSQRFLSYDFFTIIIYVEDINSAIEVFTRVNTAGQTLTLFEIMSAKIYDQGDFRNKIDLKDKKEKEENEVKKMILSRENDKFEMKSTFRFDSSQKNNINKKLEYVVAKTISSFLNAEGGTLIIGVDDNGNILGIDNDISTLLKKNIDGFELRLRQIIRGYLGSYFEKEIKINFLKINNKEICMIEVRKSPYPVFIKYQGEQEFFVRIGNASIPKTREEQSEYEKLHWKK